MKRYDIAGLKRNIMESTVNRSNILSLFEAEAPKNYVDGRWGGYTITLPDGIQLKTKNGIRGKDFPVKVFNEDGQYKAFDGEHEIPLVYVLNEAVARVVEMQIFD